MQRDDGGEEREDQDVRVHVAALVVERLHARAAFASVIAAGFHGESEIVRATEG